MSAVPRNLMNGRNLAFSAWLDLFRGLSAFAVVFSHVRVLFLNSVTPGKELALPAKILYFLSGYGHIAVMAFFVLSGYLVGGTVVRSVRDGTWSWRRYLLHRCTRLYIVLIPALILTVCWDYAERLRSAGLAPNNDSAVAIISSEAIRENTSVGAFAGNVAFLQQVVVPSLGSNTPLWSLANEFWYYLIFPLVWPAVSQRGVRGWVRAACVAVAASILVMLGPKIAVYFIIWLLGVVVAVAPGLPGFERTALRRTTTAFAAFGMIAVLVAVRVAHGWAEFVTDAAVAMAFALLLYCMKHNSSAARDTVARRVVARFAEFSYTLYLAHMPLLAFLRACWTYEAGWEPSLAAWLKVFLITAVVVAYAYLLSLVTERQTDRLRRWLGERLGRSLPRAAS